MKTKLVTLMLTCAVNSAGATDIASLNSATAETPAYCKGLVIGGLASREVTSAERTKLWLAWNYVIRSGALHNDATRGEYQAGWGQFQAAADTAAAQSVAENADRKCGLRRSGYQITGW
ncbi:MAG: hypothetical protein P8L39_13065 [Halioglobus sp.]|nr:hypothetical protein [Halioglobus sp.]